VSPKRYFVTGTGTGVGKTFVTCGLAKLARDRGLEVVAHKPIETGCSTIDGIRVGEDQRLLHSASSAWFQQLDDIEARYGSYQFAAPLAPSVAAQLEGTSVDMDKIQSVLQRASRAPNGAHVDLFFVEGAGGWRVPITEQHDMRDLARMVGGEVIVVGLATLGTINHSLLTLEAVERDGFSVASLILSNRPTDDLAVVERNAVEIGKRWRGKIIEIAELSKLL
jgi:dethiobiotin synthetase